jgi:type I restriction enzyme S subunit
VTDFRLRLYWDEFKHIQIVLPALREQIAIAAFLDRETAKIDALVADYRALIELLQEKRQAVISQAVTKGLDPTVPMKDSGVEWLGEVPEHWDIMRLKWISPEITVGIVVEPSKYYVQDQDRGVPALRSLNIRPGRIDPDNMVLISEQANEQLEKSRLIAGDLVAVRSGQPGTTAVVPKEISGCNCIDLIIIRRSADTDSDYLCWYMNSDSAQRQFFEGSGGAIQKHFNIGTAMDLLVVRPPLVEQREITGFLQRSTEELDSLTTDAESAITLLQERRTALISAAVTGKIDVRGLVAIPENELVRSCG